MPFNDDEPIAAIEDKSGLSSSSGVGKVTLLPAVCKKKAPLEETNFKVLVELKGERGSTDRPGVDLVTVLDVSLSMKDDNKLQKLKLAMRFLIRKLDPIDRLSIVSFARSADRLCGLRKVTKDSLSDLEGKVDGLFVKPSTNIAAGLRMALQVLKDRRVSEGRVGTIMLMSDGDQNVDDATQVQAGSVAVHTFGFGKDYNPKVLNDIANISNGGTFSFVDVDNLSAAFSQCLGGLLTVVAQDLKITISPLKGQRDKQALAKIKDIYVGSYSKSDPDADGSVTVSFGDIYANETRKFLVHLVLFSVDKPVTNKVLKISGSYSYNGEEKTIVPRIVGVERTDEGEKEPEQEEVIAEEKRQETIERIKKAMLSAEGKKRDDAKDELIKMQSDLEDSKPDNPNNDQVELVFDMLIFEVRVLKNYMKSDETYQNGGRAFALATVTSHGRQRFAARIDSNMIDPDEPILRMFATPRMGLYLQQAKAFEKDMTKDLPTAGDDAKEEVVADPLAPFAAAFNYHLEIAIEALKAIKEMLNPPSSVPQLTAPSP